MRGKKNINQEIISWSCNKFSELTLQELKDDVDQYQYLGNCPPTPPLTQQ